MNEDYTLNEDYTATVLKGLPIFLTNREWAEFTPPAIIKVRYNVTTSNGYVVSIVEFHGQSFYSGHQYEMIVMDTPSGLIDGECGNIKHGSAIDIHNYLLELENE